MGHIEVGQKYKAYMSDAFPCGDVGAVKQQDGKCLITLTDGLGHGIKANQAATMATDLIMGSFNKSLVETINAVHKNLRSTVGCVTAICTVDIDSGLLNYSGVGNITMKIIGPVSKTMIPKDGIVGYMMRPPEEKTYTLQNGDVILMYSDGVKTNMDGKKLKPLLKLPAQAMADEIIKTFGKVDDDKSCIVLKYYRQ